ncbi:ester cyclase [Streptomyces sp. NPDC001833]|uniref:ester cyclase n=1 Tax=Streptomyces sp. NPDC001833 TaxID=3154658 RepID=UPI0033181E7C
MRSVSRARIAVTAMAAVCVACGASVWSQVRTEAQETSPPTWPQRLVDRANDLVHPQALTVDRSLGDERATQEVHLAQQLYTFWNTGRSKYLNAAVSPHFKDNTLPSGRPQGPEGPLFASKQFRNTVPDLTCELADLLITGDKITARLVFRGHFTGSFEGVHGKGQAVQFNAIDIQRVGTKKIIEDWHIEDNQTLMKQLGVSS